MLGEEAGGWGTLRRRVAPLERWRGAWLVVGTGSQDAEWVVVGAERQRARAAVAGRGGWGVP